MMTKVKHALAFIFGALYTSSFWYLALNPLKNETALNDGFQIASIFMVSIGSLLIIFGVADFLATHWSEK